MAQLDWSGRLAQTIAAEVRRYRKSRGLSAQGLADACTELGYPIARQVLANLESGRRESVSVQELLILGQALHVAPVVLVFPVGYLAEVEVAPNKMVDSFIALLWASGQAKLEDDALLRAATESESASGSVGVALYAHEDQLIQEWRDHADKEDEYYEAASDEAAPGRVKALLVDSASTEHEQRQEVEEEIARNRERMERNGILRRPLPGDLKHVE